MNSKLKSKMSRTPMYKFVFRSVAHLYDNKVEIIYTCPDKN